MATLRFCTIARTLEKCMLLGQEMMGETIGDAVQVGEHACRQHCSRVCSARTCGCAVRPGWQLLGNLGRVGVSRSTKMAQRATIWSLSQGEMRACV